MVLAWNHQKLAIFTKSSLRNDQQNIFFNKIKNVPSIGFPHKFSISAQKVTHKGLVDAPDPQESILGPEQCRLVRFSISLAQRIAYGRDPLLDYADLKNLNLCAIRTNLVYWGAQKCCLECPSSLRSSPRWSVTMGQSPPTAQSTSSGFEPRTTSAATLSSMETPWALTSCSWSSLFWKKAQTIAQSAATSTSRLNGEVPGTIPANSTFKETIQVNNFF